MVTISLATAPQQMIKVEGLSAAPSMISPLIVSMGSAGLEHCDDVCRRHFGLNIVHSVENITTALAKHSDDSLSLFRHLLGRAERQNFLGIDATIESQAVAELLIFLWLFSVAKAF